MMNTHFMPKLPVSRFHPLLRPTVWLVAALLSSSIYISVFDGASAKSSKQPTWEYIEFESKSWGAPITSWRILPDGSGSWTDTVRSKDATFSDYKLAWYEIAPNAGQYAALEKILVALPRPAPDSRKCENSMTDMPYGTIRLTKGATTTEIAWNSGCLDAGYRKFISILQQADQLVAGWGRAGKFLREEKPQ